MSIPCNAEATMIRVVMFDLGMTLIDANNRPFAQVPEALAAISGFKTEDGRKLQLCLVSDFDKPGPPPTPREIAARFEEYLAILDQAGLEKFFEPVKRRVTLSPHAGASKPDRRIFEKALQRLGIEVPLKACLFVTENAAHIAAARKKLKMKTLQFRTSGSTAFDFDDWADAPALIAHLVAPQQVVNRQAAIKAHFAARGVDVTALESGLESGVGRISGQMWCKVDVPGFDDLADVEVAVPIEGEVRRGPKGEVQAPTLGRPSAENLAEAVSFAKSLASHGRIAGVGGRAGTPTHAIVTDPKGGRRLIRKRFSSV